MNRQEAVLDLHESHSAHENQQREPLVDAQPAAQHGHREQRRGQDLQLVRHLMGDKVIGTLNSARAGDVYDDAFGPARGFKLTSTPRSPRPYLVGGSVQVGQGDVEQVVLQRVDAGGNRQLQRFDGFVHDFLTQNAVQSSHAVT